MNEEEKINTSRTSVSTSSSIAFLKRLAFDPGLSISSSFTKKKKLIGSELIYQAIGGLGPLMSSLSTSLAAEAKIWQERAAEIIEVHYMDLSEDNRLIRADIIEEEAKARTFVLLKLQTLQRKWVDNRIGERTVWRSSLDLLDVYNIYISRCE